MPLISSSNGSQPNSQPRIPKLSYRNSTAETSTTGSRQSTSTIGTTATGNTFATNPTSPSHSETFSNGPRSPSLQSPRSPLFPSPLATNGSKKKSSLFGFFSVKDPSIAAMQQFEEQMRKEGTYKKDTQHRPLLKSTEKWDGMPSTLAKQQKEAELKAKQQQLREREEGKKEYVKKQKDIDQRQSLGSSGRLSMNNLNNFADAGNLFAFEVHSTSTLGSRSSDSRSGGSRSGTRPPFLQSNSCGQSDSSGALRKSLSDGASFASDGDSQFFTTSIAREGSTKSRSSSNLSAVAPFLDKSIPNPPEIPAAYRNEKISKPLPAMPLMPAHHPVLPTVIEPPNEVSTESLAASKPSQSQKDTGDPSNSSGTDSFPSHPTSIRSNKTSLLGGEEVVVKSSGPHVLTPPAKAKRKVKAAPFLAGEAQELQLPEESSPASILKTNYATSRSRRSSEPSRPSMFEPDDKVECEPSRFKMGIPMAIRGSERDEPERYTTPTPAPGGKRIFKSGRLGLFGKDKDK